MRIEHLRFVKILNLTRAESKAIEEATRPVAPAELLELASQQPDTLVITKVDGEWPDDVQNTIANLILQGLEPHFVPLSIRYGLAVGVLGVLLEGQPK